MDPAESFHVPEDVLAHARAVSDRGRASHAEWNKTFEAWRAANPERAAEYDRISSRTLPDGWDAALPTFAPGKDLATRAASGEVLAALAPVLPELWGGSADLAESNNTTMKGEPSFIPEEFQTKEFPGHRYGRTLHFGVREHAMAAICNGIALHGGTRPYGGTFLIFSDYMRPAVRLAALMKLPVTFVWTHDSIGLGEDGPTHQPVEHLWALRAIPGWTSSGGGRQRDGGGVADRPAAHRPPGGPRADPAEAADAGPRGRPRVRGGSPGAGTCWRTPRAAAPT